ncbi:hypothetical protein I3760_14G043400 [Carya illinoinensis]|nr:hypothetical protein I3760_14G043400 [Carya illinoinensis]
MSEGSVSLDMEARRLAVLSSHLCPLGSGQPQGQTPIPLFSALSFSDCASDSGETQRFSDSEKMDRQNDYVFCKIVRSESPALKGIRLDFESKVPYRNFNMLGQNFLKNTKCLAILPYFLTIDALNTSSSLFIYFYK